MLIYAIDAFMSMLWGCLDAVLCLAFKQLALYACLLYALYMVVYTIYATAISPLRKIPGPFLGKITSLYGLYFVLTRQSCEMTRENYYKYGDIYQSSPRIVVLSNQKDCRHVLNTHRFKKSPSYKAFALLGETMFTTDVAQFNQIRRKQIGPAFVHGYLARMETVILECGIKSIKEKWDTAISQSTAKSALVNYNKDFALATFDIISTLGFGTKLHALKNDDARIMSWVDATAMLAIFRYAVPPLAYFPFNYLVRDLEKKTREFFEFTSLCVEKRRHALNRGEPKLNDILQVFIDAEESETNSKMTTEQITVETMGLFGAGTDTTSLTMSWLIHYLMLYPEAYQRAVSEVRTEFTSDHIITYAETRAQLPYVEACIYEAMRVRPVVGATLTRVVPEGGAVFQGHFLPAATIIGINLTGMNHNINVWDNPRRFIPERFLNNETAKSQMMGFSAGVRVCPGRYLAWAEMMTIIPNILKDYDFSLTRNSQFSPDFIDEYGNPKAMEAAHVLTSSPRFPDRDCNIMISNAQL